MLHLPPFAALRAFECVARLGTVVKAAAELHVTHSAVSHHLRSLEDELKIALFERKGRRLVLTDDGRVYAMRVRMAIGDLQSATREVQSQPRIDELVLAAIPSFSTHWLLRRLPRLYQAAADLKVTVRASLDVLDLHKERVDAALRMGPGGWENLSEVKLFVDHLVMVARRDFFVGSKIRSPSRLIQAPLIRSIDSWSPWLQAAKIATASLSGPIYTDSNLVIEAVRQGQGITLTRRSLVHDLCMDGELKIVSDVVVAHVNPVWLVWPMRSQGSAKLEVLTAWLEREVRHYLKEVQDFKL